MSENRQSALFSVLQRRSMSQATCFLVNEAEIGYNIAYLSEMKLIGNETRERILCTDIQLTISYGKL